MTTLLNDVRFAMRQLRKSPGFAALAICTLAIGIGASTAIYSIVDGVLLRSLPFHEPQQLVSVFETNPGLGSQRYPFSAPDYVDVARRNGSFTGMAAYRDQHSELSGSGDPTRIPIARVTASLFSVLGVTPEMGRVFTEEEDLEGAPVVILSNKFWRKHFEDNPNVLGQKLLLDRNPYTVIGIMRPSFVFPDRGGMYNSTPADLYIPMHFTPAQLQGLGWENNYSVIARLKPGVTLEKASTEINSLLQGFFLQYPVAMRSDPHYKLGADVISYNDQVVGDVRSRLILLQLSVLLVLLIACVDVANLLLARTTGRQKEVALRIAVGAPRARIVSQLLSESLVLAVTGGLLGLPLAYGAMHLLVASAPVDLPRAGSISLSAGVLAFCFGICLLTALLTGLIPALRAVRVDSSDSLYEGGRSGMTSRGRHRALGILVTSQFALAMVLLVTAGLVLRSFQRLTETDPGFQPEHVITMSATLPVAVYSNEAQIKNFYRQLLERTTQLPGARSVGLSTSLPIHSEEQDGFTVEALPSRPEAAVSVAQNWVLGDFFRTFGIQLVRGRYFTPQDREGSMPVVIISEGLAKKYFPGMNPLGRRIKAGDPASKVPWLTIVGVVEDVKSRGMDQSAQPETYTPYLQDTIDTELNFYIDPDIDEMRSLSLAVRTQQDPASMQNLLVSTIHSLDPSLPVTNIHTMTEMVHTDVAPERFNSFILGTFAFVALLLAAAGIGGVLAYTVRQRTREIGVRMALGAQRGNVSRLVLLEGLKLAGTGVSLGAGISLLVTHWLSAQLYRVAPHDPLTFSIGVVVLFLIALLASWLPARRAASVDPIQALRSE